jgi:signal transduction histidine kinase
VRRALRLGAAPVDAGLVTLALLDAVLSVSVNQTSRAALGLSVLGALAIVVRRRWPYVTFALTLPGLWIADVLIAPLIALYTLAATSRDRRPVIACAVIAGLADIVPWPLSDFQWHESFRNLLGLIYAAVFAGAPVGLGLLVQTRQELRDRLSELTEGRDREQRLHADGVLARERARLAREMHDVVSHWVSLIAIQAGALRVTTRDDAARETAATIRQLSVRTLEELRHMVGVLRVAGGPAVELAPQPGLADIPALVQGSGQNTSVDLSEAATGAWPDVVERAAYRTVQETLTNITKHAPGAQVTVHVAPWERGLRVSVRNGPPPGQPTTGLPGGRHGLIGLRERAELLGGTLRAGPTSDGGYLVEASFQDTADGRATSSQRGGRAAQFRWR